MSQSSGWEEVIGNLGKVPLSGTQGPKSRWGGRVVWVWPGAEPAGAFGSVSAGLEGRCEGKWDWSWNYKRDSGGRGNRFWGQGTDSEGKMKVGDDCVHELVFK